MTYVNTPSGALLVHESVMQANGLRSGQFVGTRKAMALILANSEGMMNDSASSNIAREVMGAAKQTALNVLSDVSDDR